MEEHPETLPEWAKTSLTNEELDNIVSNDYKYGEYYYENGVQKRDIIGCYFSQNEPWSSWSDNQPEARITREIDANTTYKVK